MSFKKKVQGAISIFLVIVLVPIMSVAALFVDAGKVSLSKAVAGSAADLTLNTALTDYDAQLKNLYGLFATAQDTDDLFNKLEDYYKTCITSSGVPDEQAETYVEQIMAQLGVVSETNDVNDILNMQLTEFSVEKLSNASLDNATLLDKEIVEFMKYRSPINTGLSFLSALKSFSTLSKQTELVEKKQAYYEAQQTVMQDLQKAWTNIAAYNKTMVAKDPQFMSDVKTFMDDVFKESVTFTKGNTYSIEKYNINANFSDPFDGYEILHLRTLMDLYGVTKDGEGYNFELMFSVGNDDAIGDFYVTNGSKLANQDYYYDQYNIDKLPSVSDIKGQVTAFESAITYAENLYTNITAYTPGDYSIKYVLKASRDGIESYTTQITKAYTAYQKYKAMIKAAQMYDEAGQNKKSKYYGMTTAQVLGETVKVFGDKTQYKLDEVDSVWLFNKYSSSLTKAGAIMEEYNKLCETAKDLYELSSSEAGSSLVQINYVVDAFVQDLEEASNSLQQAINFLNSAKGKLEGDVATAKSNWDGVAGDSAISDTSMAKQDKAEISQLDTNLNSTNIDKLVTRLSNIKTKVDDTKTEIKKYKYCGTYIGDIEYDHNLTEVATSKWGVDTLNALPLNQSSLRTSVSTMYTQAIEKGNITNDFIKWVDQSGYQADLTKDKLAMYSYLYSHFAAGTVADAKNVTQSSGTTEQKEDKDNGENLYKKIKSTSESKTETKDGSDGASSSAKHKKMSESTAEGSTNAALPSSKGGSGSNLPETSVDKNSDTAAGSASSGLSKLFGDDFLSAIKSAATGLRDRIYVADYVLGMFSYNTIENEYKVKNKKTTVEANAIKTLTKEPINATNNFAYGSEVEYIIYGKDTLATDVTLAYASIYGIRFGFNLVYAFATSEIRDSALAIATPISAATLGIIPAPLIQAVIIIGLACIESGIDLVDLSQGNEVPLYKSSKTWHCSVTGLLNAAKSAAGTVVKYAAGTLIDEGVNKLTEYLDYTEEQLQNLTDEEIKKIEATVSNTYDQIITENANAVIQMAMTYTTDAVEELRCRAGDISYDDMKKQVIAGIKTKLKEWKNAPEQAGSDIASTVKRQAIDALLSNDGELINTIFDVIETQLQTTSGTAIEDTIATLSNPTAVVQEGLDSAAGKLMECVTTVRQTITSKINEAGSVVNKKITEAKNEVQKSINEGSEKFRETINSRIDEFCGSGDGGNDGGTGIASLFSFAYSDYLRLFVVIGEYAGREKVLLRIGDVIQKNMALKTGNASYALSDAAVYVKLSATIQSKPTFIAMPLFSEVTKNENVNSNWYTFTITDIRGY